MKRFRIWYRHERSFVTSAIIFAKSSEEAGRIFKKALPSAKMGYIQTA